MKIRHIIHRITVSGLSLTFLWGTGAVLLLTVLFFSSCSSSDTDDVATTRMPVNLYIPATDASLVSTTTDARATRTYGDPGTYEKFKLPTWSYIYIITKDKNGNDYVTLSSTQLKGTWKKERYQGALATANDSVYRYEGYIDVYLPDYRQPVGAVYAALSAVELPGLTKGNESTVNALKTADIVDQQFTMSDDIQKEIQNIYSTPYNYKINSAYYGTLNNMNTVNPSINIVLYHIASKLDIQWNVATDIQSSVKLTNITLKTPQPQKCFIFKPLENTATDTHSESIQLDAGSQWYGRDYRYVIPVTDDNSHYKFSLTMSNNGSTKTNDIDAGSIDKSQPFVPWMLGTVTVKTSW